MPGADAAGVELRHRARVDQLGADPEPGQERARRDRCVAGPGSRRGWRARRHPPPARRGTARRASARRPRAVAPVSKRRGRTPSRSSDSSGVVPSPRSTTTTTSRAPRSTLAETRSLGLRCGELSTTTSGCGPAASSVSAAVSTAISTGCCSRRHALEAAQLLGQVGPLDDDHRAAGPRSGWRAGATPCRAAAGPDSRRRNSVLLWVKLSSWAARPPRARSRSSSSGARGPAPGRGRPRLSPSRTSPSSMRIALPVADRRPSRSGRRRRRSRIPALGQHAAARGWGSGRRRTATGVDHGGDVRVDEPLRGGPVQVEVVDDGDVAGTQPGQQAAGAPIHPGGAGEPGQGG